VVEADLEQFNKRAENVFEKIYPGPWSIGPKKRLFLDREIVDFGEINYFAVKTPAVDCHKRRDKNICRTRKSFEAAGKISDPGVED
jgi:hypothetical protein